MRTSRDPRVSIFLSDEKSELLDTYKSLTGLNYCAVMRMLLDYVPWDRDDLEPVILKLPKTETASPERLKAWLAAACADIEKHYFPEG